MDEAAGDRIIPVILCGGAGTRLWPLSRLARTKPLVALGGKETLIQLTGLRAADAALFEAPFVVSDGESAEAAETQLAAAGVAPQLTIVEPIARGTATAIALAALNARAEALLLVMPSDHVIGDSAAFRAAVTGARDQAAQGWLVTFGITPDRPDTGYGYIRQGDKIEANVFRARRFAEKPPVELASAFLSEGGWSWNAGIFLLGAGAFLDSLRELAPDILAAAEAAVRDQRQEGRRVYPDGGALAGAPLRSVDHAVMERSDRVAVVPVEMAWSDVGSWEAVHALGPSDSDGNVVSGDAVTPGSSGCLVRSDGPVIVALGVTDLVIVATERAVLVVPRDQSQRVKEAIDALEARRAPADGSGGA